MANATDTVHGRIDRVELTPQLALTLAVLIALGAAFVFAPEAALHESLHDARHAAGIVCH